MAPIGVSIVTFNHQQTIGATINSLLQQAGGLIAKVIITDNASTDGTAAELAILASPTLEIRRNSENLGFCAAHNRAISTLLTAGCSEILVLNPDVRLEHDALEQLHAALATDDRIGLVTPKLLRADNQLNPVSPASLDAAGMYITPEIRHFDRGSQVKDEAQFDTPEFIFGATGAALYLRDTFIKDAALRYQTEGGLELFDEAFFAYREDADLSWRAQILGWRCLYYPHAVCYHIRKVLPERRKSLPKELNRLSVRNRFLLQLNNFSPVAQARSLLPALWRNALVIAGVLVLERSSLSGLGEAIRLLPSAIRKRRGTYRKRRVSLLSLSRWFHWNAVTESYLTEQPAPVTSVHIIVINYNSGDRLGRCVQSLERAISSLQDLAQFSVTVVDNASSDRSADAARSVIAAHSSWQLLVSRSNLGFAGGINAGARRVDADALLVLNPDVELTAEALRELVTTFGRYGSLSLLSPTLLSPTNQDGHGTGDKRVQHGFTARRLPTLGAALCELFFLHRLLPSNPWTEHYLYEGDSVLKQYLEQSPSPGPHLAATVPYVVEQPAGACFLVRSDAFWELFGFNEEFFPAWFEDVDFCKRLAIHGRLAAVLSSARVIHEGGYSVRTLTEAHFAQIWYGNHLKYWLEHGTNFERLVFRLLLPAGLLLRSAVAGAMSFYEADKIRSHSRRALAAALAKLAARTGKSVIFSIAEDLRDLALTALRLARIFTPPSISVLSIPPQGQVLDAGPVEIRERDWRSHFASHLSGAGLEIGALHRPLLTHERMKVQYVDRLSVADLRKHYPELERETLVEPEILDDGERLETVPDGSQDFVIAAHLIEHTRNPVAAILNWLRVLKTGGHLYLIIPDKRHTFDKKRVRTSLEHILLDYDHPSKVRDFEHFIDYACHVSGKQGNEALLEAESLRDRDYSIHFHVFIPEDVVLLLQWISHNVTPLEIVQGPSAAPGSDEFHLLIRKPRLRDMQTEDIVQPRREAR